MTTPRTLRASAAPLAVRCPGSVHPAEGEVLIDPVNEAADLGSAVHEIMATIVRDGLDYVPPCTPVAQRWGVDADELAGLSGAGLKCWRKLQGWVGDIIEVEAECRSPLNFRPDRLMTGDEPGANIELTGHADVQAWGPDDSLIVIDWKTGRLDADHYDQMAAYASLLLDGYGDDGDDYTVYAIPVWLREGEIEVYQFQMAELNEWRDGIERNVIDWDGTYHPGPHCAHCPRAKSCPGRRQLVQGTIEELEPIQQSAKEAAEIMLGEAEADPAAVDRIATLYDRAKMLEQVAADLKSALREGIAARGGTLEGNEKKLAVETQNRRYLKTGPAWSVLSKRVGGAELLKACSISRTKAMDLVTADVPKGSKKATREEVEAELDAAGAVEVKEIKRLSVKRSDKAIESKSGK